MKKYLLITSLSLLLFSSCRIHTGFTHNENQQQTQVVLSNNNYRIIKYVEGIESTKYYFAIGGGADRRGLEARARENMLREAGLIGTSRAVINEKVEFQARQYLFLTEVSCIVSAYVIEFFDPEREVAPDAEESVYIDRTIIKKIPVKKDFYVQLGANYKENESFNEFRTSYYPAGHVALGIDFSTPKVKYIYWGAALEASYLSYQITQGDKRLENNEYYAFTVPLKVGLEIPVYQNYRWYLQGAPHVGFAYFKDLEQYDPNAPVRKTQMDGAFGLDLSTGFKLGDRFKIGGGYYHNFFESYNHHVKASLSVYF